MKNCSGEKKKHPPPWEGTRYQPAKGGNKKKKPRLARLPKREIIVGNRGGALRILLGKTGDI